MIQYAVMTNDLILGGSGHDNIIGGIGDDVHIYGDNIAIYHDSS